jgi:hypothetical protein
MSGRLANSWALVKASAAVLRSDPELVIYPIVSSIACIVVTITFLAPAVLWVSAQPHAGPQEIERGLHSPVYYAGLFLFYLAQYFVIFFSNSALVGAAVVRLRGGAGTRGDGFKIAAGRIGAIFGYALLAATVGVVLRTISERLGFVGRIVIGLIGLAWNIATFLVAPVLIVEGVGPIDSVKRSASLLKKTWGEQLVVDGGIGLVFGLLLVACLVTWGVLVVPLAAAQSVVAIVVVSAFMVLAIMGLILIQASLSGIFTAALYLYAMDGRVPPGFDEAGIQGAFRPKK